MIRFLLDTNVVSELARPRPNPGLSAWLVEEDECGISAVTVEEIRYGLTRGPHPRVISFMESYLASATTLPVTEQIAHRSGTLRGEFARRGIVRAQPDMFIAATAQAHGLTLVTRNTRDFEGCGIALLNPFTE